MTLPSTRPPRFVSSFVFALLRRCFLWRDLESKRQLIDSFFCGCQGLVVCIHQLPNNQLGARAGWIAIAWSGSLKQIAADLQRNPDRDEE